jgi:hypothetical protein
MPAPVAPAGFSGPGCQSCGGNSLNDLMSLKLKAQELESRATAALAGALRDNVQTHQAALAVLNPGSAKTTNPAGLAAPAPNTPAPADDLYSRVESLSKSVDATLRQMSVIVQQVEELRKSRTVAPPQEK